MSQTQLSDHALSILTFAAYHSLVSGEVVTRVVLDDGKGHKADSAGVEELEKAGLLEETGDRGTLTEAGSQHLGKVLEAIRKGA
jgi:chromosome segregation and condensation protein ScpB